MAMKKDIPAFPMVREEPMPGGGKYRYVSEGMTLRDYFAASAKESDIYHYREEYTDDGDTFTIKYKYTREQAKYRYADAMLAARDE